MAIKLNQGADATLVGAAYRSAVSNTPGDYSRTFENAAKGYEKTMQAQSTTLGNVLSLGASIGKEMVGNANERAAYAAKASALNNEDAEFLMKEIYGNKDAQKELSFWRVGFGDRETRKRRSELKIDQQELFAEIDLAAASINAGSKTISDGLYVPLLGNEKEAEMVNAIIKGGLKNRVTGNKNIARLGRDKESGDLMYTLYNVETNPDGDVLTDENGDPRTMTIKQFNKSIATNTSDGGALQGNFSGMNEQAYKMGLGSDGAYDPQMKQINLNQISQMVKSDTDLQRAFDTKIGYSTTSFKDDLLTSGTPISIDLYNTLLTATGQKNENGELILDGIADGVDDKDNSGGISREELLGEENATNYGILAANILGMKDPDVSRAYFTEYAANEFEETFKYGYSKKAPVAGTGTGTGADDKDGIPDFYSRGRGVKMNNKQIITGASAESLYTAIQDGITFEETDPLTGNYNEYSYNVVDGDGGWYGNYKQGDTPQTKDSYIGSGSDLASIFTKDQRFRSLKTTVEERVDLKGVNEAKETRLKGDYSTSMRSIDINTMLLDDNKVASELNKFLPPIRSKGNSKGYAFYTTQDTDGYSYGLEKGGGDIGQESATLYRLADENEQGGFKGPDGYRIIAATYPQGHPKTGQAVVIEAGGSLAQRRQSIANIDSLFNTAEFKSLMLKKPRP